MGEILIPNKRARAAICQHLGPAEEAIDWVQGDLEGVRYIIGLCNECATSGIAGIRMNTAGKPVVVLAE